MDNINNSGASCKWVHATRNCYQCRIDHNNFWNWNTGAGQTVKGNNVIILGIHKQN